jgi:hypothetical protein
MRICNIYIKDYDQFSNINLDFTDPETSKPVNKVCFIGKNGTGKSKILNFILLLQNSILPQLARPVHSNPNHPRNRIRLDFGQSQKAKFIYKISFDNDYYLIYCDRENIEIFRVTYLEKDKEKEIIQQLLNELPPNELIRGIDYGKLIEGTKEASFIRKLSFNNNSNDLLIYSPAESNTNEYLKISDVPLTNVNEALKLFSNMPYYSLVSSETVSNFWRLLIYNLKKRDEDRENYERENLTKTKAQLIDEFNKENPEILKSLANIWNKILGKSYLEFDVDEARNPIQLTDNLRAYIKVKSINKVIRYNALSTGIRNFIFRIGHIYSLYFNREVDRAFLLIDEPENSLFPDILLELIDVYNEIVVDKRGQNNTQMFFATHNPIVAAQFKPFERVILDWNEDATVKTFKGSAPEGDDPNDVLKKDFAINELMGHKGLAEWIRYLELKRELKKTTNSEKKMEIAAEINRIGQSYNFPA